MKKAGLSPAMMYSAKDFQSFAPWVRQPIILNNDLDRYITVVVRIEKLY